MNAITTHDQQEGLLSRKSPWWVTAVNKRRYSRLKVLQIVLQWNEFVPCSWCFFVSHNFNHFNSLWSIIRISICVISWCLLSWNFLFLFTVVSSLKATMFAMRGTPPATTTSTPSVENKHPIGSWGGGGEEYKSEEVLRTKVWLRDCRIGYLSVSCTRLVWVLR